MDNKEKLKIIKALMLLYVISFLVINWNDISWLFNYREMSGLVTGFFNPYPGIENIQVNDFYPNHDAAGQIKNVNYTYTEKQNNLEIPKINISVPIVFSEKTDSASLTKDLNKGAVYYPGSVYPEENGQIIILGHSAPENWPKATYDWIFSDLNELAAGDVILLSINNRQYTYKVVQKEIIKRGQEVASGSDLAGNRLFLISCWPPGKDYQRIAVEAELQ